MGSWRKLVFWTRAPRIRKTGEYQNEMSYMSDFSRGLGSFAGDDYIRQKQHPYAMLSRRLASAVISCVRMVPHR